MRADSANSDFFVQAEEEALVATCASEYDTSALKRWRDQKVPEEEKELQDAARLEVRPRRKEIVHELKARQRTRKRAQGSSKLRSLAKGEREKGETWTAANVPLEVNGTMTLDREEWRDALHLESSASVADDDNDWVTQCVRVMRLDQEATQEQLRHDVMDVPLDVVFEALAEAASGKQGGFDHLVAEIWKAASLTAKTRIAQQFRHCIRGTEFSKPDSWTVLDLNCLAKEPGASTFGQHRRIAL